MGRVSDFITRTGELHKRESDAEISLKILDGSKLKW